MVYTRPLCSFGQTISKKTANTFQGSNLILCGREKLISMPGYGGVLFSTRETTDTMIS